jgi:hypothetical protein
MDERLSLFDKLAPQGATAADTSLPRSTHLEARVNALLRKVPWSYSECRLTLLPRLVKPQRHIMCIFVLLFKLTKHEPIMMM